MANYGCLLDPRETDAVIESLIASGRPAAFGDGRPQLKGHWELLKSRGVKGVFLQEEEKRVLGTYGKAFWQGRGTCVGQAFARAVQDSIFAGINSGAIATAVQIPPEYVYAVARNRIGKGTQGKHYSNSVDNDGTYGAWAAEGLVKYGVPSRGKYGNIDLTKPNESFAIQWGDPGPGVPSAVYAAAADHKCDAFHCPSVELIADALAAKHGVAICIPRIVGNRDSNGMSKLSGGGNHATELCGVFETPKGDLGFVYQQSWGESPNGPNVLKYDGGEIVLRQGSCGIWASDLQYWLSRSRDNGSEAWAVNIQPGQEFRPTTLMA